MKDTLKLAASAAVAAVALSGCLGSSGSGIGGGTPGGPASYQQVDRLNRPAVNEVFATFAQHQANNIDLPSNDAANLKPQIVTFMTSVAGRSAAIANVEGTVLTPDVLTADLSGTSTSCIGQAPGTCNDYLGLETGGATQAPSNLKPFGGRALTDDIVSLSLGTIFGGTIPALNLAPEDNNELDGRADASWPGGHRPNLTSDNVTWQTAPKHFTATFPYLGAPQ